MSGGISSIGPAFDYLLANLPAVIAAVDPETEVSDSWPTDSQCQRMFVIGRESPEHSTSAAGTQALIVLGASRADETYEIPCFIQVLSGGTNATAQEATRTAALLVFNTFVSWLFRNLNLGGALQMGNAQISSIQIDGTPPDYLGTGRSTLISFGLRCTNKYNP